eukprot:scaffold256_cov261-Pinguiococcus_pyrenoidosus.AAC.48
MGGAHGEASTRAGKEKTIAVVKEKLEGSLLIFSIKGDGITVGQINELRASLPEGTTCSVVKNTLMRSAVSEVEKFNAVDDLLSSSNLWFFCDEENMKETMKVVETWIQGTGKKDTHGVRGGAMEGKFLDAKAVEAASKMPTKKELIQRIAVNIKGVPQRLAKRVNAVPTKVARAVKLATVDEQEGAEGAAE